MKDEAMRKVLITLLRCGSLSCAEFGRLTAARTPRSQDEAHEAGAAMRSRLLQAGYILPSPFGNRDFRHQLTKEGRRVAASLVAEH
jgi:hypothetical protein